MLIFYSFFLIILLFWWYTTVPKKEKSDEEKSWNDIKRKYANKLQNPITKQAAFEKCIDELIDKHPWLQEIILTTSLMTYQCCKEN